MPDLEKVLDLLGDLTLLKFFPSEPAARLALAKLVAGMATSYEQVEWLVARTLSVCNDWPGPLVLRQIFCSRFKPVDGIEAGPTSLFPEGLPPAPPALAPAPAIAELPPGPVVRALEAGMSMVKRLEPDPYPSAEDLAHEEELRRARLRREHREIMEALGLKPLTQADIDRAVEELRAKKRDESV